MSYTNRQMKAQGDLALLGLNHNASRTPVRGCSTHTTDALRSIEATARLARETSTGNAHDALSRLAGQAATSQARSFARPIDIGTRDTVQIRVGGRTLNISVA